MIDGPVGLPWDRMPPCSQCVVESEIRVQMCIFSLFWKFANPSMKKEASWGNCARRGVLQGRV